MNELELYIVMSVMLLIEVALFTIILCPTKEKEIYNCRNCAKYYKGEYRCELSIFRNKNKKCEDYVEIPKCPICGTTLKGNFSIRYIGDGYTAKCWKCGYTTKLLWGQNKMIEVC